MNKDFINFLQEKNSPFIKYLTNPDSITYFDPTQLKISEESVLDCSVAIFGMRRTGKTFLLKEWLLILNALGHIGKCAIITSTPYQWEDLITEEYIFDMSKHDIIEILEDLVQMQKRNKKLFKDGKLPLNEPLQLTLIIDDFSYDRKLSIYSDVLAQIFQTGRHDNIAIFALVQNPTGVGNWIRQNADYAVLFKTRGEKAKDRLHNEHFDFMDKKIFYQLAEVATNDRYVLISCKTDPMSDDINKLYRYKATINVDKFDIGKLGNELWLQKRSDDRKKEYRKKKDSGLNISEKDFLHYFNKHKNINILFK